MSKSHFTLMVLLGAICFVVVGFAIWSILEGGTTDLILGVAVVTLALAQILSFATRDSAISSSSRRLADIMSAYGTLSREIHGIARRLTAVESGTAERAELGPYREWAQRTFARAPAQRIERAPRTNVPAPVPPKMAEPAAAVPQFQEERFDLYLEPVVQIEDGSTRHYRASLSLRMTDGTRVGMETIQHQAVKAGLMPMLDILTVSRVMPVLRKLMQRQRGVGIFCTASAASLADAEFIARLDKVIADNTDIARGLVVEIRQQSLADLSPSGQEGLTKLAERGVTFCLGDANGQGPDVQTLSDLGFQFVALDIMTLANANTSRAEEVLNAFTRDAQLQGQQVIAANVSTRTELAAITGRATLGYGTLFSPPRLVRHEVTAEPASAAA
ncbi:MAG TPA: EAL domain-containing protein [Allosphingosinicella sp.]|nr:EAL domain-containing protein [Allosphingosinicella sp.]